MPKRKVVLTSVVVALCLTGCAPKGVTASVAGAGDTLRPNPGGVTHASTDVNNCKAGTVTVKVLPYEASTPVCVRVGALLVMTGGYVGTGGYWPGPPTVSDGAVLRLISSVSKETQLTARFRAMRAGSATVEAAFVSGNSGCSPTPCTPVPGGPLVLDVTVVPSSARG